MKNFTTLLLLSSSILLLTGNVWGQKIQPKSQGHLDLKLNKVDALHLIRRTSFGVQTEDLKNLIGLSRKQAINKLIDGIRSNSWTQPPVWSQQAAPPFWGRGDLNRSERNLFDTMREKEFRDLQRWWIEEIVQTPSPLTERMVLFWHNHFVSAFSSLNGWSIALARQNQMFRRLCIGSFRDLLIAVLQDPAMLNYLDNDKNRKQRPNENLGRELMELFTLGEGHFTEKDVKEASRALTGWRVSRAKNLSFWNDGWTHDKGHKLILGREGKFGPLNLVDILLDQPQTASYITRKFWRYFISETWNEPKEIRQIASNFRNSGYNLKLLLKDILSSEAFWSLRARGTIVKSPADFVIGSIRTFQVSPKYVDELPSIMTKMGQELFNHPNVGGWPGGSSWVTPSGIIERINFSKRLLSSREIMKNYEMPGSFLSNHNRGPVNKEATINVFGMMKLEGDASYQFSARSFLTRWARGFKKRKRPVLTFGFVDAKMGERKWRTLTVRLEIHPRFGLLMKFKDIDCDPTCLIHSKLQKKAFFIPLLVKPQMVRKRLKSLVRQEQVLVAILANSLT